MRQNSLKFQALLPLILFILAFTGCIRDNEPEEWSLKAGDPLPDISLIMADGSKITTKSLAGRRSAIIFFNTSCRDCRRELPTIQKAMEENPEIAFICIARDETKESIESFWKSHGLTLPYSPQPDRSIYNQFATAGIPRIYIISPDLIITHVYSEIIPDSIVW